MMIKVLQQWCTALPEINGTADNALDPILYFAWVYYQNPAGQDLVQGRDPLSPGNTLEIGPTFLSKWNEEYLSYINSKESAKLVYEWIKDPRIKIKDYQKITATDVTG